MPQALATGAIPSVAEGRRIIERSHPLETYNPKDTDLWDAAEKRLA